MKDDIQRFIRISAMNESIIERPIFQQGQLEKDMFDVSHEAELRIETLEVFENAGLRLHPLLREMLLETSEHRFIPESYVNNRRGSGYMQATRFLAEVLCTSPEKRVCALFDECVLLEMQQRSLEQSDEFKMLARAQQDVLRHCWKTQHELHMKLEKAEEACERMKELKTQKMIRDEEWVFGDRQCVSVLETERYDAQAAYDDAKYRTEITYDDSFSGGLPKAYKSINLDLVKLHEAVASLTKEEDILIGRMIQDLLDPYVDGLQLPSTEKSIHVGTCTTAETYFLAVLDPVERGYDGPTIVRDAQGEPFMILKNAGEASGLLLREGVLDGVRLPAGSLIAVSSEKERSKISDLKDCTGFEFLRLTTLAVSPEHRMRAFGMAIEFQNRNCVYEPKTATLERFYDYAKRRLILEKNEI